MFTTFRLMVRDVSWQAVGQRVPAQAEGCFLADVQPFPELQQRSERRELTFEPPWDKHMMSEAALLDLGFW